MWIVVSEPYVKGMSLNEIVDIIHYKHRNYKLDIAPKFIAFTEHPRNSDLD